MPLLVADVRVIWSVLQGTTPGELLFVGLLGVHVNVNQSDVLTGNVVPWSDSDPPQAGIPMTVASAAVLPYVSAVKLDGGGGGKLQVRVATPLLAKVRAIVPVVALMVQAIPFRLLKVVRPVGPAGPVGPGMPCGPCWPCGPCEPAGPCVPVAPWEARSCQSAEQPAMDGSQLVFGVAVFALVATKASQNEPPSLTASFKL